MLTKTEIRELTFKYIFSTFFLKNNENRILKEIELRNFYEINEVKNEDVKKEIYKTLYIIQDHYNYINDLIKKNLKSDWEIDRISKVDLSIIFLAIAEMVYEKLPYKIAINEAVELAHKYGTDNSPKFINGILASVVTQEKL